MKNLQTEWNNGEIEHYTYYDHLRHLKSNGQSKTFKETLKELDSKSLFTLLRNNCFNSTQYDNYIEDEINSRLLKKYKR